MEGFYMEFVLFVELFQFSYLALSLFLSLFQIALY